jgi:hypothetical protein
MNRAAIHTGTAIVATALIAAIVALVPPASPAAPPQREAAKSRGAGSSWDALLPSKIKFKDGSDRATFSIKPEPDGAKLVGADEKELARYHAEGDRVRIKGAGEKVLGYVVGTGRKLKVESADRARVLAELKVQDDGDAKVEDGRGALLYRLKKRDDGFKVEDASGRILATVKVKGDKTSLRDAGDKTLQSTKDRIGALPVACLALERAGELPIRVGLLVRLAIDDAAHAARGEAK